MNFIRKPSRRLVLATLLGSSMAIASCAENTPTTTVVPNPGGAVQLVSDWNETALQAVRDTAPGPTVASRAYAIVNTAMFDAWATYDPVAIPTQLDDSLQRPTAENTEANKAEAISFAAHQTLVELFPNERVLFDTLLDDLGYVASDAAIADATTPEGVGMAAAIAIMEFRINDGANQANDYADTTGYTPVNDPLGVPDTSGEAADPESWQPLCTPLDAADCTVQTFLTPHWFQVTPFALESSDRFRPPAPPAFETDEYVRQVTDILTISANLTDEQKVIAEFWEDGNGTSFPPGHWLEFGQFVSQRDELSLDEEVQLFFMLGNAVFDAGIATWEAKRFYDYVRPITAIRTVFAGQEVTAWAGPGQDAQTIDGSEWIPYQDLGFVTPPFAEYVSGHSAFSAAAAEVLRLFTGSDTFGAEATIPAGGSIFEPEIAPDTDITLSWATFSEAADESGISRRYGGIHIEDGDLNGRTLGRQVGAAVFDRAQFFINGGD